MLYRNSSSKPWVRKPHHVCILNGFCFDCFLAASKVGERGIVTGVDLTPEIVCKAGENAKKNKFVLGDIEKLPIAQNIADVIISKCVINLSPDQGKVFKEAFRVLKPGKKLMISDIVLLRELPKVLKNRAELYVSCVSGAALKEKYLKLIEKAGFEEVKAVQEKPFPVGYVTDDPAVETSVLSVTVYGKKPK
ncbi:MAG: methyltransferase domain-containing protein [Candidatus Bathycorpusculaceae bacterium]